MLTTFQRVTALALVFVASTAGTAFAQETAADPDTPETMPEEGTGSALQQAQNAPADQPGTMDHPMGQGAMSEGMMDGLMNEGMTGQGMMCSEMCAGMGGGMTGERSMDGTTDPGMMDHGRMGEGRAEDRMPHGMMGSMPGMDMHRHAMRMVFAIADANGDGGLSLEEIADIQARIFQAVDGDDDGIVTPDELQAFMHGE